MSTEMNQILESTILIIGHLRQQDTTGQLVYIVLQQTQLEVGTSAFFLSKDPGVWAEYCTNTYITQHTTATAIFYSILKIQLHIQYRHKSMCTATYSYFLESMCNYLNLCGNFDLN